ncbi:Tat pathway signal sequence domain protein, partial [Streptomyces anthocyanicus]
MCVDGETASHEPTGQGRRGFLRNAALAGAGAVAVGAGSSALGAAPAHAADASGRHGHVGRWNPDPDALRFTLAVMPDTQYLYWGSQDSVNRAPQEESFRYIVR